MTDNPFISDSFTSIWSKHFNHANPGISFRFIQGLKFVKHRFLPIYTNHGKTLTKGIDYTLDQEIYDDFKNRVFLIYDVPAYFNISTDIQTKKIGLYKVKQYPGFLIRLENFNNLNDYMLSTFSKSSRYKLKKYQKRLELCFEIRYKMFYGDISKNEYDDIFENFKILLEKRFTDKQITNNNLDPKEWNFYHDVAYPMILEKKASLFVIYNDDIPIGITLNYFSKDILFDAITVFDIDYSKFHLGSVTIMKLIEYCLNNNIRILDFSKGHFDYKDRWSNKVYDFEYHLYYNSSSIISKGIGLFMKNFFELKQILRDRKLNEKLHRLKFLIKNRSNKKKTNLKYEFSQIEKDYKKEELTEVNGDLKENYFLKTIIFDFLYLNKESLNALKIYKVTNEKFLYLLQGKNKTAELRIKSFTGDVGFS